MGIYPSYYLYEYHFQYFEIIYTNCFRNFSYLISLKFPELFITGDDTHLWKKFKKFVISQRYFVLELFSVFVLFVQILRILIPILKSRDFLFKSINKNFPTNL